jgi:hypothetical protein
MHFTDSVMIHFPEYCWGERGKREFAGIRSEKVAVQNLTWQHTHYTLSYLMALKPTFTIWQEDFWISHRYEERQHIRCVRENFIPYSGDFCIIFRAVIESDTITIDTPERFRELFAPVESVQQAVAFAHIFTGATLKNDISGVKSMIQFDIQAEMQRAKWDEREANRQARQQEMAVTISENDKTESTIQQEDSIRVVLPPPPPPKRPPVRPQGRLREVHQTEISSSNVERTDDGFKVWLYCRQTPHYEWWRFGTTHTRKLIKVTFDGKVEILESIPVYSWIRSSNDLIQ